MHAIGAQIVVMLKSTIKVVRNQTSKGIGSQIKKPTPFRVRYFLYTYFIYLM